MTNKRGIIVDPMKTNLTANGGVQTLNVMGSYGAERKFADMVEQNSIKYLQLRDEEQLQYAKSYILEQMQDGQDFQMGLKTDDSYYKSGEKFQAFSERRKQRREQFEKLAREKGIASDILENALSRADREFGETQAVYGKYTTDYLEEENKKRNILLFDENSKTMSKFFLNNNIEQGAEFYKDGINTLYQGFKNGYLTVDQFLNKANQERENAFMSDVYSYVNDPDGLAKLQAMSNFTYEQFVENYDYLRGKFGDYVSELTHEDYARWQRGVSSSISGINTRNRASQEKTLLDKAEAEKKLRDNPVDSALDLFPINTNLNEIAEPFTTMATNFKYGTNFKSIQEIVDNGYAPVTIQGKNSKASQYMDINLSAAEYMQTRLKEVFDYAGGLPIEQQIAILDEQYNDGTADYIMGYTGTVLYAEGNTAFRYVYDNLYTAENKQILAKVGKVDADWISAFGMYQDDFQAVTNTKHNFNTMLPGQMSGNPYKGEAGIYGRKGDYVSTSLGGTLHGYRLAGMNGDKHAARIAKDCEQLIKDTTILLIMQENGGLLSEDLAEELKIPQYANQPLEALTQAQRNKVFNAYLEDPGRLKQLFGGENQYKKQVRENLENALKEMTAEAQTADIGNGRFLNIRRELNASDVAKGISSVLQTKKFMTQDGLIAPSKEIKVVSKIGSDDVLLFYNNKPLLNEDGSRAYINIGGVINE